MVCENCVLDLRKYKIETIAADEIFVKVKNTMNYWVSNYGRMVNNLYGYYKVMKYDPNKNIHYTINITVAGEKFLHDTFTENLVADAFLEKQKGKNTIYHIDGNAGNCYYKNLMYVTRKEKYNLINGALRLADIETVQYYIPYITNKRNKAHMIWNGIYKRCYDKEMKIRYPHYRDATMYEGWKNDPELFCEWYEANYYDVLGEIMHVDKDLLFPGNKEYSPNKCCLLPQTLNCMLSNGKKHYKHSGQKNNHLPLGVRYDENKKRYYSQIQLDIKLGSDLIVLPHRDTPEEAFRDYKMHKQACILIMADKYKEFIPSHIYNALLKVDIQPY